MKKIVVVPSRRGEKTVALNLFPQFPPGAVIIPEKEVRKVADKFGLTNDKEYYEKAVQFREAMVADGWSIKPSFDNESLERATDLEKEGFKCMILTRTGVCAKYEYRVDINIWGPDGLAIIPPEFYDWEKITAGQRRCNYCGKENVETHRVGFAGRVCDECGATVAARVERPGWTR